MIVPPIPPDEAERLTALQACNVLDTLPAEEFDGITQLAAALCQTPISLVTLIDTDRQWFKSRVGFDAAETPRAIAFCAHAILDSKTMIVSDTHLDDRFHDNPLVVSEPFVRFYAGVPLTARTGQRLGTLCVLDRQPRTLASEQVSALETLASHVAAHLELLRRLAELERAENTYRSAEAGLRSSQQQLQNVIDGSRDGFWDWNIATGEIEISKRLTEMLGYEKDEIGSGIADWLGLVHPDDDALRIKNLEQHLQGALPHYETEHRKRTKSGEWRWVLSRGKVTERAADGTPLRMTGTHTDIDKRKRAEETLDHFFKLSLDLLCIAGLDGVMKRVNPSFTEMLGYTAEELMATTFLDFIHPEDRARAEAELASLRSGTATIRFDVRCICRDGSVKWTTWTGAPHAGSGLIYAAGRDVTEERLAGQVIAESEEKYRDLFENATDMIQSVDRDGKLLYVNHAWLDTLGYDTAEVAGLTIEDVIDPESVEHCHQLLRRVMAGERIPKVVVDFRSKDGRRRTVEGTVNARFENGQAVSTRGIFRDVTEQKKAEEEVRASESAMRSIIRSSLSGIATFDQHGMIESVNPAAEKIFGYPAEELIGRSASFLLAHPPADLQAFQQQIVHESIGQITEWEVVRRDGRQIQIELALFEFETVRGKQLAGNIQDISQRREVERMKREFVSTVSHELRTPLTSIRGSLDLLQGNVFGQLTPEAIEVVAIANRNTTRLIELTNDILDLERHDNGKFEIMLEQTEVESLFRGAIESVRAFAEQSGVTIRRPRVDIRVEADSRRIIQVLTNLLSNAIKFSFRGSGIRLTAVEANGEVEIRVQDEGRGIPKHDLERIFDRFHQVDASDSRTRTGSGLGLTISRAIVEQHGGSIGVVSDQGIGSTFWIRLPRASRSDAALPAAFDTSVDVSDGSAGTAIDKPSFDYVMEGGGEAPVIAASDSDRRARWRFAGGQPAVDVLIVEDDQALLAVLRMQLEIEGLTVRTASTGSAAIIAIRRTPPRLIVLDVGLPDMEGFAVVAVLREDVHARNLPLVVYTGRTLSSSDRDWLQLGPTRFLTKATSDDRELRKIVAELLRDSSSGEQR